VWREDFLAAAWALVLRNGGAAGVDGETFEDIEATGAAKWLNDRICARLGAGSIRDAELH